MWRPAVIAAVAATVASVCLALLLTLAAGGSGPVAGLRVWLVSVGSGLTSGSSLNIGIVPLGATVLVALVFFGVSLAVLRTPTEDVGAFGAVVGGVTGVAAALISAVTNTGAVQTSFVRAAFGAFAVAGLAAALAAAVRSGQPLLGRRSDVRRVADGAVVGVAVVFALAVGLVLVRLVLGLDRAAELWATLDPGGEGWILGLLVILAFPTMVVWASSFLLGPGFVLGADTSIDLAGVHVGALPAFPALVALPDPGPFGSGVLVLAAVPVLAGIAAGWRVGRRAVAVRLSRGLLDGAAAGAIAGAVLGGSAVLSRGGVGPGLLGTAGPPMWTPLLIAVPVLAVGGAVGAGLAHYRGGRVRPEQA